MCDYVNGPLTHNFYLGLEFLVFFYICIAWPCNALLHSWFNSLYIVIAVISNHAQQERDSLKLEPASTEMEPVDRCSDINVVSSDHPLGGAQLPGGVFHCEVCSREFGSLSRFMDHRNEGCVSSENGMCLSMSMK